MDLTVGVDGLGVDEVVGLYESVGWTIYAADPPALLAALAGSHLVLAAREDGGLVGLARTISDGVTICYVQDLLVHPDHHRHGLGRLLLGELLGRYGHCRQFVLSTDARAAGPHAFYRAMGLVPHDEVGMTAFTRTSR